MRLVNINDVEVGSQIAKPVYDSKLSLLINKGAKLSENVLNKLINADIRHLYIEDEISKGVNLEPMISSQKYIAEMSKSILAQSSWAQKCIIITIR